MASIVFGDQTVNLYNWPGYMDNRGCDFLSAAASDGQILPAFLSASPSSPSTGYNVLSKFNIVQAYLLDGTKPISQRLDAAEQLLGYLEACFESATARWSYINFDPGMDAVRDACNWSQNYYNLSKDKAMSCRSAIGNLRNGARNMRDTLLAGQNQEISETEVQIQLNSEVAALNNLIAKTQQAQDAAKLTAFIKDVLVYVVPVIAVVFLYLAFRKKKA